ncbi:MAG TPA: YciI family protein [Gemmatimonadales bacterium]|nr:YciI family protein [Gemmatimonadales bacterium]
MHYLILIADNEKQWEALSEAEMGRVIGEFAAYSDELKRGGHYVVGRQLAPSHLARTLRTRQGRLETVDGPFAETKEQIGGFHLISARDQQEAERLAARCPGAKYGTVELRPVIENGA